MKHTLKHRYKFKRTYKPYRIQEIRYKSGNSIHILNDAWFVNLRQIFEKQ